MMVMMMMMIFSLSGFNTLIEKTLFTFQLKWCQAQIRIYRRSVDHLNKIKNPQIRKEILQVAKQSLGQLRWRSHSELPYEQNSRMKLKRQPFCCCCYGAWAQKESAKLQNSRAYTEKKCFIQYETGLNHPNRGMIGKSKEFEDVSGVASSFPTYLGKIEATLLAG